LEISTMRFTLPSSVVALSLTLVLAGGCNPPAGRNAGVPGRTYLSVEFPKDTVLRYKIVSSRDIELNLDPGGKASKSDSGARQDMKEEAELVLAFKAAGSAGRGGTLVEAKCESATVKRQRLTGGTSPEDALASLAGRTYKMSVSATGQIFDTSDLEKVIKDLGEAAFGNRGDKYEGRRIKNPDMVADFITVQWFMWDQEQSVPKPTAGLAVGDQWKSRRKLLAPFPFVARTGRDASYTLADVTESADGHQLATIKSTYSLSDGPSMDWPIPYTGTFSQRGSFGFFQGYKVLELSGDGEQVFDVAAGRIVSDRQSYTAKVSAVIPFGGLGKEGEKPEPNIVVRQTITMTFIPAEEPAN
jgi:hypothetical protein